MALVIEHDHFVVSIICFLENALKTFLETRSPISRRDDNRNDRLLRRKRVFGPQIDAMVRRDRRRNSGAIEMFLHGAASGFLRVWFRRSV